MSKDKAELIHIAERFAIEGKLGVLSLMEMGI